MATSRYINSPVLNMGSHMGTSQAVARIRAAVESGRIPVQEVILRGRDRLDTLAGEAYGDARYWWLLAAASNIGWSLQVPPGTVIKIPDIQTALSFI